MSKPGKYSSEGDEYQLQIALHWSIEVLLNDSIDYMAIDIITIPTNLSNHKVEVDDIFIEFNDGKRVFIQAKKNETNHSKWNLSNPILKEEINKTYKQYLNNNANPNHKIYFYSATPFGDFQKVVNDIKKDKLYSSFLIGPKNIKDILKSVSKIISQSEEETFKFLLSINFGSHKTIEEWSNDNLNRLKFLVTRSELAKSHLEYILRNHQIGESGVPNKISKKYLEFELKKVGLILTSMYEESEVLKEFSSVSKIGRNKDYSIKGHYLIQKDIEQIINILKSGNGNIIVTDKAGGGKSCLLDNVAKYFECSSEYALLCLKGDEFNKVADDKEFYEKYNMPKDMVGKIVRISEHKKVIVIIDSLDVIALNKDYGTLKFFLSIIDRIQGLDNVSLLVASRTFDLKYESSLRERKWDIKIELKKFDFDNDIKPLLDKLNIPTEQINLNLKNLLTIPQNISLFVRIYDKIPYSSISTEYDLFNSFVDEVIIKDEYLGLEALEFLGEMSCYCISNRSMNIPNNKFQKKQKILQRLKSQEIVQIDSNMIKFSHQTLLDIFVIRNSINKDENFLNFITSTPQFPFIRPIVRSYFFILYSMDFKIFQKQILQVLSNNQVTYHLKRLLVESFSELEANELNWKLIQRIEKIDKYLFERFFNVIKSYEWFEIIKFKYVANLLNYEEKLKWTRNLLFKSDKFINSHTKEFIDYYNKLINGGIDKELLFPIFLALTKLDDLKYDGIYEILKYALKVDPDKHFFAEVLSKYIDQTDKGDDLLWQFIIKDLDEDEFKKYSVKLNCEDHNFRRDNFLEERFIKSEYLLTKAFKAVESWSSKMYGGFLDSSFSYEKRHSKSDMYGLGAASRLIDILEKAIIEQAKEKTNWWQNFEQRLLNSKELFFTYVLIQIYEDDIINHIDGIIFILTKKEIVDDGYLKDEILPLLNKSFPYLNENSQLETQELLLTINDEKDNSVKYDIYYKKDTYEYLLYIPTYLRTKEVQDFIDRYKKTFGLIRKSPSIKSWGGLVRNPITRDEMSSLSPKYLLKLFEHYNKPIDGSDTEYTDRGYVGGKNSITGIFYDVVLQDPKKYLYLFDILNSNKKYKSYLESMLEGIHNYIEHVDGNLSFGNKVEVNKDNNTFELANTLLKQVERNINGLSERVIVKTLKACSIVLKDKDFINRIIFILYPIFINLSRNIYEYEDNDYNDIDTLNSISGILSGIVIKLSNNYIENKKRLPKLLETLLIRLSRDGMNSAKVAILERLPYLISKNKTLGWRVFDNIIINPIPKILDATYYCFYYNYHKDFVFVSKYLDLFYLNYIDIDECAEILGRIYTLSYIDQNISQDELYFKIENSRNEKFIEGVISIFTDESNFKNYNNMCVNSLKNFLQNYNLSAEMVFKIERLFFKKENFKYISLDFVESIIYNLSKKENRYRDINALFEWLEYFAQNNNVRNSLDMAKVLVLKIEELNFNDLYTSDKILSYLLILLQEADDFDDEYLIKEVLDLQERLFKLNIQTDKLYEEYEK
jgi:hypothetical protein